MLTCWVVAHGLIVAGCSSGRSRRDAAPAAAAVEDAQTTDGPDPIDAFEPEYQRRADLHAVARDGGVSAYDALRAAAHDESAVVRAAVPFHLTQVRPPDALDLLRELSHDPERKVRINVAEALGLFGTTEALDYLLAWGTADADARVRFLTAGVFVERRDRRIVPFLEGERAQPDTKEFPHDTLDEWLRELR